MRIFLSLIFLFSGITIVAQTPVESVIAIKTQSSKFQFVNKQTHVVVDSLLWDDTEPLVNGFAKVYRNKKSSLVNASGKPIAPAEFDEVMNFSNKLCAVKKDGKWGFIDVSGKLVIPCTYDIAFNFSHPTATAVYTNKKWYLISNKAVVIEQLDITVYYGFKKGVAKVVKDDKEGILYPDGRIVWNQAKTLVDKPISWHPTPNNLSVPCPDNIGFEYGDFTNWQCFTGTVAAVGTTNVITVSPSPPVTGSHTIIPRQVPSLQDPWGFFDINAPDGSNFAVRLGGEVAGGQAERLSYTIHVPLNDSTFSLKYDYAVVLQSPNHALWEQPRFISRLIDSATGAAVNCASLEFVATAGLPGFKVSPRDAGVLYKPWASVFYSLKGYGGKTLYLEFTTADCVFTAHWGYAYLDVQSTCGSPVEIDYNCLPPNQTTLTAPPGFQRYNWWNSDFSTLLGTGQQLNMNPGLPVGSHVWVEIVPYIGFGCLDTLLVKLDGTFDAKFDIDNPGGCGKTYTFYSRNIPSTTTTWNFGDGNTASGDTVTHTYSMPGSYQVTMDVTMPGGCIGNAIHLITIYPPTDMIKPVDQVFCNRQQSTNIIFTGTPPGLVFNWTNNNPSIGIPASGTGNILSFLPVNTGNTPVVATIIVTPTHLTCTGTPDTFKITVNPSPDMLTLPISQALCNGSITNAVTFTPTISSTTFIWTNSNPSIGLASSGIGDIPSFTAINTSSVFTVAAIRVIPINGICPGVERVFTIRVNPTPNVAQPGNITVCKNGPTGTINFTGTVAAATFNWTNTNTSIGLAVGGIGNIPSFNGINTGTVPETGFITVTPMAYGCPGAQRFFTITVNPKPDVNQPVNQALCNGAATNALNFTGAVAATSFIWTNDNPAIGLAANGNGDIPSFIAINTTNAPVTANIAITPLAYGCPGAVKNFTITVNPTPNVLQPGNQVLCNLSISIATIFSGAVSGTVFSWTNDNTTIGLASSGAGAVIPSFNVINSTNAPVIATITVTPSANGCPGTAKSFTIIVNPSPDMVLPANQTLCNASSTAAVNFTSAVSGTTFTWTNTNTLIGLAANGTGNIPSFTVTNSSNAPISATIIVTPTANGCPGTSKNFTITVNPTPNLILPPNQALCNGATTNAVNFTGAVSGSSFSWSNNNPSIGLAASGNGDIPSFTALNVTNAPVLAIISVAPFANGCQGAAQSFSITVYPTPDVVLPNNQVLCNGVATSPVNFAGFVNGTTFNWTNNNTSIGLSASGSGNIPSFTATNLTNAVVIATITVTPTASGCPGPLKTFTITVNPTPNVVHPGNQVLCNASTTDAVNFTGNVSGTGFSWINDNPSIGLAASGTGNIPSFTAINVTTAPITSTIIITASANNCVSAITASFTITVNPTPNVVQPPHQVLCNATATNAINYAGAVGGTAFSWINDNTSIGLAANGVGDIPSFTAINATNAAVTAKITVTPSANGCPGPAQNFTITVNPTPDVVQPTDQRICDGVTTNIIILSGSVAGTSFNWINSNPSVGLASSGTGNIASFTAINKSASPVIAAITITPIAKGCAGLPKTPTLIVDQNPIIELGNDLHLSTGTVINLNSTIQNGPIINWAWTPATGLSCNNCPSPQLSVANNITYNVAITNLHGCIASDNISISTFCTDGQVFFPNAFTPDGNNLNDVFILSGKGFVVKDLRIFNRWGELIFQKTNFNPNDSRYGWDGTVRGKKAAAGVYAFIAEVVCDNGINYPYKGTVILFR